MKATAATKWVPFMTRARAAARAAMEQEELMVPNAVAVAKLTLLASVPPR